MGILAEFPLDTNPEQPPPPDSGAFVDDWERIAVMEGLRSLIVQHGEAPVLRFLDGAEAGPDGVGYLVERFGKARLQRMVRNLAAIHAPQTQNPQAFNDWYPRASRAVLEALETSCGPAMRETIQAVGFDAAQGIAAVLAKAAIEGSR